MSCIIRNRHFLLDAAQCFHVQQQSCRQHVVGSWLVFRHLSPHKSFLSSYPSLDSTCISHRNSLLVVVVVVDSYLFDFLVGGGFSRHQNLLLLPERTLRTPIMTMIAPHNAIIPIMHNER
mmetsp:Transcript_62562/g.70788  ORF Transcript_62562/g.70788 Transcript_62562/m.70788 type:complete len:120 (-) Transcript_62562:2-361(-)